MTGSDLEPASDHQASDADEIPIDTQDEPNPASFATEDADDAQTDDEIDPTTSIEVEEPHETDQDENEMDASSPGSEGIGVESDDEGEEDDRRHHQGHGTGSKHGRNQRSRVTPAYTGTHHANNDNEDSSWMHEDDENEIDDEDEFRR